MNSHQPPFDSHLNLALWILFWEGTLTHTQIMVIWEMFKHVQTVVCKYMTPKSRDKRNCHCDKKATRMSDTKPAEAENLRPGWCGTTAAHTVDGKVCLRQQMFTQPRDSKGRMHANESRN